MPDPVDDSAMYDVSMIAAPLFDRSGTCLYCLCLGPLAEPVNGVAVIELGGKVLRASVAAMQADRIRN